MASSQEKKKREEELKKEKEFRKNFEKLCYLRKCYRVVLHFCLVIILIVLLISFYYASFDIEDKIYYKIKSDMNFKFNVQNC